MLVRWVLALVLIIGLVVAALDLSAWARHRARARRPPSVVDVVTGREDPSLPHAPEVDEAPPSTSPAITY